MGHSHPEICEVITDQMGRLDHLLSTFISEPVADLVDLLTSLMPDPLDKVGVFGCKGVHSQLRQTILPFDKAFALNTGSETTEAALKIAKCASGKFEVIAFAASYRELKFVILGCRTGI